MKPVITIFLIALPATASFAQKWDLRLGFNNLKSYCDIHILSMNNPSGNISITGEATVPLLFLNRGREAPLLSNFWDISVIRHINSKHALVVGIKPMQPFISSCIKEVIYSHNGQIGGVGRSMSSTGIDVAALKLNYLYKAFQGKRINPSCFALVGGIHILYSGRAGSPHPGYIDTTREDNSITTGVSMPRYPIPFLNAGIEASLRLGRRFKVGVELTGYIGPRTMYTQRIWGETKDAEFTYEVRLKPYFISGGVFVQYRIE